jgi:hypothetical protein
VRERVRNIHAIYHGEQVVLPFTYFYDLLRTADVTPDTLQLLMRDLIGQAVGESSTPKLVKMPRPVPELEEDRARAGTGQGSEG